MDKKPIVLFDIDYTLFDTKLFKKSYLTKHKIYEEVRDVLEKLSKIALLGIFSEGDLEFQRKKLNQTEIADYFEKGNTHVVLNKLTEIRKVLQKYIDRKTFFVDDKLNILFDAKKIFPKVVTIWVKRGIYAENQKDIPGFKPDAVVANLSEVVKIVNSKLVVSS
jgi:FMN phosphatase YigB (HAD superfamily)